DRGGDGTGRYQGCRRYRGTASLRPERTRRLHPNPLCRTMIAAHIQPLLLVTGFVTTLAVAIFVAPRAGLKLLFGVEQADPMTMFIARHWGLLVALVGGLLVAAAYEPGLRVPAMALAVAEKLAIVAMIAFGPLKRTRGMLAIAWGDGTMAVLYVLGLLGL